jgi:hypothetical protein
MTALFERCISITIADVKWNNLILWEHRNVEIRCLHVEAEYQFVAPALLEVTFWSRNGDGVCLLSYCTSKHATKKLLVIYNRGLTFSKILSLACNTNCCWQLLPTHTWDLWEIAWNFELSWLLKERDRQTLYNYTSQHLWHLIMAEKPQAKFISS